jgi:SulP family sulfate permease
MLPASLVSLIICTAFEHAINRPFIGFNTRLVSETAPINGAPPAFHFPSTETFMAESWPVIIQYAVMLAFVGLIESVMTLQALDVITQTPPSLFKCNQECVAQGLGNFVCSLFGAMGGDAMIGQSTINTLNGARGRVSGMVAGLGMFVAVVAASSVIEIIPVPALTGILFMVVVYTFNWNSFKYMYKLRKSDAFGIVLVTAVAVWQNLAIAVAAGVVWSALGAAWDNGSVKHYTYDTTTKEGKQARVYVLQNNLFFGAVNEFRGIFSLNDDDPEEVVLDFRDCRLCDFSAVVAVAAVVDDYERAGKKCSYQNLDAKSRKRMEKAGNSLQVELAEVLEHEGEVLDEGDIKLAEQTHTNGHAAMQELEV